MILRLGPVGRARICIVTIVKARTEQWAIWAEQGSPQSLPRALVISDALDWWGALDLLLNSLKSLRLPLNV